MEQHWKARQPQNLSKIFPPNDQFLGKNMVNHMQKHIEQNLKSGETKKGKSDL